MKSFEKEIAKYAKKERLKVAERKAVRERILSYMEYHPLSKTVRENLPQVDAVASESFVTFNINTLKARIFASVMTVLVLIVVPVAAERSVPGDVLYPVKTKLNEGIRAQFVNSPYEQVVFETKLLERRISEARLLAKEGKLTEEVEAVIAESVRVHAEGAKEGIDALKVDDAEEGAIAEIAFGSALEVQSAVFDAAVGTTSSSSDTGIAGVVRIAKEAAAVAVESNTQKPSYELLIGRVEMETTRAYELFESIKLSATIDEQIDIERRLSDIGRSVLAAEELRSTDDVAAVEQLRDVLSLTQKLVSFMTDIDIRENVSLETLVPVKLTDEELTATLTEQYDSLSEQFTKVKERAALVEEPSRIEKIAPTFRDLEESFSVATTALLEGKYDLVKANLSGIADFISDFDYLLPEIPNIDPASVPQATTTEELAEEDGEGDIATDFGESVETIEELEENTEEVLEEGLSEEGADSVADEEGEVEETEEGTADVESEDLEEEPIE